MSLVRKNFLLTSSLIAIVSVIILSMIYFIMPMYYRQVKRNEIHKEFKKVVSSLEGKTQDEIVSKLSEQEIEEDYIWFTLIGENNLLIYPQLVRDGYERLEIVPNFKEVVKKSYVFVATIQSKTGERMSLIGEYSLQSVTDATKILLGLYPTIIIVVMIIGCVAAYIYSRASSRRLQAMSDCMRQMIGLNPDIVCPVLGKDEVADLARDTNSLYENLLNSIETLKKKNKKLAQREKERVEFFRMTSHELKTPITSLMGMVDGMIHGIGQFKDRDTYLLKSREILEEQARLIQSILSISKFDMDNIQKPETFSIKNMLLSLSANYHLMAEAQHRKFVMNLTNDILFTGSYEYLLKAIKNLLDNAFYYSKEGGEIYLSLTDEQLSVENEVDVVLSTEQLQQIFLPFYRPDFARRKADGGTGLGLFIVQRVLEQHKLSYRFEAVGDDKMCFSIFFDDNIIRGLEELS